MDDIQRRAFMQGAAFGALAFTMGGAEVMLTPRQARAQNVPLKTLSADQAATLDAMGETLVPGAKSAGVTNFVDQQISGPPEQALLQARILNVRPPYANFYRAALAAIDGASDKANGGRKFAQLSADEQKNFVNLMRQNKLDGWQSAGALRLRHPAQRCGRRDLCHDGRLCRARRAVHAPYRSDGEVVT
jgi:hypothetical protein